MRLDPPAPETAAIDPSDSARLQQALSRLPDGFRLAVTMFYFEGCSYREIADQLGVPLGTVMSRLARAKGYLRAALIDAEKRPCKRGRVKRGTLMRDRVEARLAAVFQDVPVPNALAERLLARLAAARLADTGGPKSPQS